MKIVLNHLTRMQSGYVCVAGVDVATKTHVRPIPARTQLRPSFLARRNGPFDMAVIVDLGPTRPIGEKPAVEDHEFDPSKVTVVGTLAGPRFWNMLTQLAKPKLTLIFGNDLRLVTRASCAVDLGKGLASLGCLVPAGPPCLYLRARQDKPPQVRIRVSDGEFDLDLGVTDLRLYGQDHRTPDPEVVSMVADRLRKGDPVILSVGLTRPFAPSPDVSPSHWLQVNNVHFNREPVWQLG